MTENAARIGMNPVTRILYLSGILDHPGIQYEPTLFVKTVNLHDWEGFDKNRGFPKQPVNPDPSAIISFQQPFQDASELDAYVRQAARNMIQQAIDLEVQEFLDAHAGRVDAQGRRYVIRNGHLPERQFLVAAGPVQVRQPRVRDTSPNREDRVVFTPKLLPRYLRRSKAVNEMIPWLYLKGISTSDFPIARQSIFGESVKSMGANTVVRLKEKWTAEYEAWNKRDLTGSPPPR